MVINFLAILAAAVVAFVIGAFWYSPLLFGTIWAREIGITPEKAKAMGASMYQAMAGSFVSYLVTAYILAMLFDHLKVTDAATALWWGFLLWLGFVAAISFTSMLYTKRSSTLTMIDSGYHLLYIEAIAVIVALWR